MPAPIEQPNVLRRHLLDLCRRRPRLEQRVTWERPKDTGPEVNPARGRQIAWQNYVRELRLQGREADDEWLDALVTRYADDEAAT
jgi:hypothetical protein